MKKINKKILISIFIFLIVILISISIILASNTNNNNLEINKEKLYNQIRYFDSEIISMSNSINISDWENLKNSIKRLYNYWNSTILDLNNLEIDKNYLTDFGKTLDALAVSIKNQDRQQSLDNIVELYKMVCIYAENLGYDKNYTNILLSKYHLLISYSIVEKGNWTLTHENILKSTNYLSNVLNSMNNNQYNQYNINQAYIAVKELENLINVKDLDVFYIKYNIAMEKLENI